MIDDRVLPFLKQDTLRNVMPLKMIRHHREHVSAVYAEVGQAAGVVLVLPTAAFPYDRRTYGDRIENTVIPVVEHPQVLAELMTAIPSRPSLFKLCDSRHADAIGASFRLDARGCVLSYTATKATKPADPSVVRSSTLDDRIGALFALNDYAPDELDGFFAHNDARSFALFDRDRPVSVGFTFRNFADVYEIGGIRTVNSGLRRGLAARIVNAAIAYLIDSGYQPRYVVSEANTASQRLASSCQMERYLTVRHYTTRDSAENGLVSKAL